MFEIRNSLFLETAYRLSSFLGATLRGWGGWVEKRFVSFYFQSWFFFNLKGG